MLPKCANPPKLTNWLFDHRRSQEAHSNHGGDALINSSGERFYEHYDCLLRHFINVAAMEDQYLERHCLKEKLKYVIFKGALQAM